MSVYNPSPRHSVSRPPWPEAVQILARRKLLAKNYSRLLGELRSHRRAAAIYSRHPSVSALVTVSRGQKTLDATVGRYMRTLKELRGAVEVVFPVQRSRPANRRLPARSR